ncbi:MAG: hypothetical protein IJ415_04080 [Clostridia bacterium]|nr:hypothetical protein [Clostridia bacterium]
MISKSEYLTALYQLGFVKETASRTDGSRIKFQHIKYPNLFAGIDDHKNTKEMSQKIHKELLRVMTLTVYIECKDDNNVVDFIKVQEILGKLNRELAGAIIKNLQKLDNNDINSFAQILPKKLYNEILKIKGEVNCQEVVDYIT